MPALDKVCLGLPCGLVAAPARDWTRAVGEVLRETTGETPYIKSVQVTGMLGAWHFQGSAIRSPHLAPERVKVVSAVISRRACQYMTHPWCGLRNGPAGSISLSNATGLPANNSVRSPPALHRPSTQALAALLASLRGAPQSTNKSGYSLLQLPRHACRAMSRRHTGCAFCPCRTLRRRWRGCGAPLTVWMRRWRLRCTLWRCGRTMSGPARPSSGQAVRCWL